MSRNKIAYFNLSALLYICIISSLIFLWHRSGIIPSMIFLSHGPLAIVFFCLAVVVFVEVVQGIAYMLYRLLNVLNKKNKGN